MKPFASRLDDIFDTLDSASAPGGSVAVEIDGSVIYGRGFGLASIESGLANTPRTRGRIGSITKQFTCLSAMLLAEDGLLDVDAPLQRWIPELHPELPPITVRQAMNHTAGLRCWVDLVMITSGMLANFPESELLPLIARQRGVQFEPGSRFLYSNTGARLLTLLIERISGKSYEAFLRERIFAPLGMWDTCLPHSEYAMLPALACPHIATGQGFRRGMMPSTVRGEGGLVSTAHDLMRWTTFLRNPHIGSAATWREMLKSVHFPHGGDGTYGLGLVDESHRGTRVLHHAGAVLGANAQMLVAPEHKLGVAILVNRSDISATELGWKVLDTLLGEKLMPVAPPAAGTADIAGFYVHAESGRTLALDVINERLCFDHQSQYTPLTTDGDAFVLNQIGFAATRLKVMGEGSDAVVLLEQPDSALQFDRMTPLDNLPYLQRMSGRYFNAETDTEVRIHADGPAQFEIRGPYGRSLWRLEALDIDSRSEGDFPEFWLMRPLDLAPVRWVAMRLVVRDGTVQAVEINTPRTWALHFERM
ncbi:MAG TPA: serine hydrolase domain-containing protein [Rhodanobacter sp.]|jgi:CubicO group peptidase (beta-lactamase class C family)|nr:serine hydrolase domain-containing protein [Rhodanobacter sp.]